MIRSFAAQVLVLFLCLQCVHGAVAICLHASSPTNMKGLLNIGYYLWDDHGQTETLEIKVSPRSVKKLKMNKGVWSMSPRFKINNTSPRVDYIGLVNDMDKISEKIKPGLLCDDKQGKGSIHYGCYDSDALYCDRNRNMHNDFCKNNYTMNHSKVRCESK